MEAISITVVVATIQMIGVWSLTGLFFLLSRSASLPYLTRWSQGWLWLSIALMALQVTFRVPGTTAFLQPVYHFGELAFLWHLHQGCRQHANQTLHRASLWIWSVGVGYSILLPHLFGAFTPQFVLHACLLSVGLVFIAWNLHHAMIHAKALVGIRVARASLVLLAGLFAVHAITLGLFGTLGMQLPPAYARFTSLYDFLAEMLLAFGLILMAMQDASNRILALTRLLPVCGWCRKIRDDHGYWTEFEAWVKAQGVSEVTHGICPECHRRAFPEMVEPLPEDPPSSSSA